MQEENSGDKMPDAGLITITLRRSHVRLAALLLVGFVLGYATAKIGNRAAGREAIQSGVSADRAPIVSSAPIKVDVSGRPARGDANAPVTIVEFMDYQCPYCARHFRETYHPLINANIGHLRYVVRQYPVSSLHPDALKAAEAAECAFEQGKFWEYHEALFERSPRLPLDTLKSIAARLRLDTSKFDGCVDSSEAERAVLRDLSDGKRYGVIGTPTFFVNGRAIVGAQPLTVIQAEIDRASEQR